jgi:hypothetical protein
VVEERTISSSLLFCFFFLLAFGTIGLLLFPASYYSRFGLVCEIVSGVAISRSPAWSAFSII